MCCAKARSIPKYSLLYFLCAQATPAIAEPTQDCFWKTSQDEKPSLPGLFFLDSHRLGL